ncbi:hypothetical protein UR09_05480 [Candidatus Nitromaritima sp. SCGC AAA799-A02]|nr:hypothetical protein UR09_05480 [Candidatus Nitromaritima sp. SCGC AAA799-A02]
MARILHRLLHDPNGISYRELYDTYNIESERALRDYVAELKAIPELFGDDCQTRVEVIGREEERKVFLKPINEEKAGDVTGHIVSIYFAISMLRFLKGTDLEEQMEKLYFSLYKGKDKNLFLNLDKKIYSINEWPKDYRPKARILRDCLHSLIYRKRLKINYKALGKQSVTEHELQIYTLLQYRHGLYLIGKTEKGDRITVFALERITKTEKTRKSFNYPSRYSPEDYIDGAFGLIRYEDENHQVVVNFDKVVEEIINSRKWHKTATTKKLKDGTIQLSMTVSALDQVVPWVLSFGQRAKVLKPRELKDMVKEEIKIMSKTYKI